MLAQTNGLPREIEHECQYQDLRIELLNVQTLYRSQGHRERPRAERPSPKPREHLAWALYRRYMRLMRRRLTRCRRPAVEQVLSIAIWQDERCGTDYSSDNGLADGAPLVRIVGIMHVPDNNVRILGRTSARVTRHFDPCILVYGGHGRR